MDSKSALDKIKEAELKAEELVEAAKKESLKIIQLAGLEREKIIQAAKARAREKSEELRKALDQETTKESSSIKQKFQAEQERIEKAAGVNIDAAVDFLKNHLE
ncbi:MAG: hypothetical protein V2A59_01215 [Candidatus Omnitrophota bacterium]